MKGIDRIADHARVSEKEIEKHLCRRMKESGGLCLKYSNPADTGYPDRLAILPGCIMFFVELKSKGCKPSKLQRLRIAELESLGVSCFVVDSKEAVDSLINFIKQPR